MMRPSAPLATTRRSSTIDGQKRLLVPTPSATPARAHAATERSASARFSANGFSQNTGLPACATRTIWSVCSECGVASTTACTRGSASARSRSSVKREAVVLGERQRRVDLLAYAVHEAQLRALALRRGEVVLAPPAEADECGIYHECDAG